MQRISRTLNSKISKIVREVADKNRLRGSVKVSVQRPTGRSMHPTLSMLKVVSCSLLLIVLLLLLVFVALYFYDKANSPQSLDPRLFEDRPCLPHADLLFLDPDQQI